MVTSACAAAGCWRHWLGALPARPRAAPAPMAPADSSELKCVLELLLLAAGSKLASTALLRYLTFVRGLSVDTAPETVVQINADCRWLLGEALPSQVCVLRSAPMASVRQALTCDRGCVCPAAR